MAWALATSVLLLALAGGCAHRLWHSPHLWQALVFAPAIVGVWAASFLLRTPTDASAVLTFLTGDIALFGLAMLGVMRLLGGLPVGFGVDGDGWGPGPDSDEPAPEPPPAPEPGAPAVRPERRGTGGAGSMPARRPRGIPPRRPRRRPERTPNA